VLPALVSVMDDGCNRVQAHAAAAVINFCEHCDRTILQPYLQVRVRARVRGLANPNPSPKPNPTLTLTLTLSLIKPYLQVRVS